MSLNWSQIFKRGACIILLYVICWNIFYACLLFIFNICCIVIELNFAIWIISNIIYISAETIMCIITPILIYLLATILHWIFFISDELLYQLCTSGYVYLNVVLLWLNIKPIARWLKLRPKVIVIMTWISSWLNYFFKKTVIISIVITFFYWLNVLLLWYFNTLVILLAVSRELLLRTSFFSIYNTIKFIKYWHLEFLAQIPTITMIILLLCCVCICIGDDAVQAIIQDIITCIYYSAFCIAFIVDALIVIIIAYIFCRIVDIIQSNIFILINYLAVWDTFKDYPEWKPTGFDWIFLDSMEFDFFNLPGGLKQYLEILEEEEAKTIF